MDDTKIKVLLIEDDSADAELVKRSLRKSGASVHLHWARTLAAGIAKLRDERFDIVLSDLSLPDCIGHDTIVSIRETASDTPIVVLTGLDDERVEYELLQSGVEDYVVKGEMNGPGLKRAMRHSIQRHENATRIRELLGEVEAKNAQLNEKNEKLGRLYAQANEFVDNVSHEFRTPLTVVKEYISLVREGIAGEVNAEQSRLLNVAEDRADDLNTMVDDMLDISKLEAGMLGAWRKNGSLGEIVEHLKESLERKARVKNVQLTWEFEKELPAVYCDAEKVRRVIINLATNAIKFCGNPGVVRITARPDFDARELCVSITDNGPGIDDEGIASIFERFKQLNHSIRSSTKGFGLGLNIARELVDLNFGQMDIESELGKGSSFSFTLPFAEPLEVTRRYLQRIERLECTHTVSVVGVTIPEDSEERIADDFGDFLNHCLRKNDLLFCINSRHWIVALPEPSTEIGAYLERVQRERDSVNRNRPFGPLPAAEMDLHGSWHTKNHEQDVLSCVSHLIESANQIAVLV